MDTFFLRNKSWMAVAAASIAATVAGCKTVLPPKELLDARAEYERIAAGPTVRIVPDELHLAREALDSADKSFTDNGDAEETRDRAYVAMRKAQLAEVLATTKQIDLAQAEALRQAQLATAAELTNTRKQLAQEHQRATMTEAQLAQEHEARIEAERRAKEALENLAKMASIKEESRGMVITLSGAVLFPSGQSVLLPGAMAGLDNVVTALKSTPDRSITVEGHTDSQGTHAYNMDLSQHRADSVREYLVSRGLPGEIVHAHGLGPDRPIADNNTPEGRANNRRVEIIVSPPERK
jgi:outer membrane protein OmpA-like peptidoglycan-associated protein